MQTNIRAMYKEMCNTCKIIFKKIVLAVYNDQTKSVSNLMVFFCKINSAATIKDDKGITPIALINCQDNKYAFFFKNNLINAENNLKVPITNQTIMLSQATIDKILTYGHPISTAIPKQKAVLIKAKQTENIKPVHNLGDKAAINLTSEIKFPVNTHNKINKNNNKINNLIATLSPVVKKDKQNLMAMQRLVYTIKRKVQLKIWSLVIILLIIGLSFGVGSWQLYRHFLNSTNNKVEKVVTRTNISSLGGDLTHHLLVIDDKDNASDVRNAFLRLKAGANSNNKLNEKLLAVIKDENTTFNFNTDYQEDQNIYSVIIIVNAEKAKDFYGKTSLAIGVKSKRFNLKYLPRFLENLVFEINSTEPKDILEKILLASKPIDSVLKHRITILETMLENIKSSNELVLKINKNISKTHGEVSDIELVITSKDKAPKYKGKIKLPLKVKWIT